MEREDFLLGPENNLNSDPVLTVLQQDEAAPEDVRFPQSDRLLEVASVWYVLVAMH
jgi:hypothetical protein